MREVREFSVVEVLESGLRAYVQGARLYLPLVLFCTVSAAAIDELSGFNEQLRRPAAPGDVADWAPLLLSSVGHLVGGSVLQAGLAYGIVRSLRGGEVSARELWGQVLRLLPRVVMINGITILAVGIGALFLVVPGVLIWLVLWVAVPAAAVERCGVFGALRRSGRLTNGRMGPLFGLLIVHAVVFVALLAVIGDGLGQGLGGALAYQLLGSLFAGAAGAIAAAAYHDLRILEEGARGDESLAA